MGCDIHCYMEYKHKERDEWKLYKDQDLIPDRHYGLFELLAGVRGSSWLAVVSPRGKPEDMSYDLKTRSELDMDNEDFIYLGDHSFTWLNREDVKKALTLLRKRYSPNYSQEYIEESIDEYVYMVLKLTTLLEYLYKYNYTRLVIGFDS